MGWEDRESTTAGTFHGDHDAAGLGNKNLTTSDPGLAGLKIVDCIPFLGTDNGEIDPFQQGIRVVVGVASDLFPPAFGSQLHEQLTGCGDCGNPMKLGRQSLGDFGEKINALGKRLTDLG